MKIFKFKYIIFVFIFLFILTIQNSIAKEFNLKVKDCTISMQPTLKKIGSGFASQKIFVQPENCINLLKANIIFTDPAGESKKTRMEPNKNERGSLIGEIPSFSKGTKLPFYIEIIDSEGSSYYLPPKTEKPFLLSFREAVSKWLLFLHIFPLVLGLIASLVAAGSALNMLINGKGFKATLYSVVTTLLGIFFGGLLMGCIIAYKALGVAYEGFPFGTDVTDTKTTIIFLYWLVILFLVKGSLFSKKENKDLVLQKTFCKLTILGTIITVVLYLIPHSITF